MKILTSTGLTKLIQLIKSSFIKVTDTESVTEVDISEAVIDDTAGDGDVDKTWSADKLTEEFDGKIDKPIIKSTMDSVAVAGAQYYLGTQSAVIITMPTDAELGQEIKVFFKSGATAATLACDLDNFDYTPKANTAVLLTFRLVHKADTQVTGDEDEWIVEIKED